MCLRFQFCLHQRVCVLHFLKKSQIRCTLMYNAFYLACFPLYWEWELYRSMPAAYLVHVPQPGFFHSNYPPLLGITFSLTSKILVSRRKTVFLTSVPNRALFYIYLSLKVQYNMSLYILTPDFLSIAYLYFSWAEIIVLLHSNNIPRSGAGR